jgi:hypothetical protein
MRCRSAFVELSTSADDERTGAYFLPLVVPFTPSMNVSVRMTCGLYDA